MSLLADTLGVIYMIGSLGKSRGKHIGVSIISSPGLWSSKENQSEKRRKKKMITASPARGWGHTRPYRIRDFLFSYIVLVLFEVYLFI